MARRRPHDRTRIGHDGGGAHARVMQPANLLMRCLTSPFYFRSRGVMLRFSTAMIAIVTLAGVARAAAGVANAANYNNKASCQARSLVPEARSIDWTQAGATQHCLDAEQLAREQL